MNKHIKKNIILATPTENSIQKVLKFLEDRPFVWAYFGEDVSRAIALERQIENRGQRLEIAKKLQKSAKELRQPYIDYIGKLSLENNSLRWWASLLSEKKPGVSRTFLHSCYIKTCQSLLNSSGKDCDFVFIIENRRLTKSLIRNISPIKEYQIKEIRTPFLDTFDNAREWLVMLLVKVWFIVESVNRILLSKYFYKSNRLPRILEQRKQNNCMTLVHTWVDWRSFEKDGRYKESYFGELVPYLRKKGEEVVIVPYVLSNVSYFNALKNMQKSGEKFLLPYAFLSMKDILSVTYDILLSIPTKRDFPSFEGIEISELIYDDFRRDWAGITLPRDLILYHVIRGLKKSGVHINSFIYPFENQTWEKVFCIVLREFYPEAKIIGYQHSSISTMLLNYFYSSNESDIIPLPDKIITNGRHPERLFKESGYDPQKVVCGGAIRYASILEKAKMYIEDKVQKSHQKCIVLVTASGISSEAELIWKVLKAFGNSDRCDVIIKCHPAMPYKNFASALGVTEIPKNFKLSQRPISVLLKNSNVLIYTSSTTCIEALAWGVPIIHIESDFIIDIDPLDFVVETKISVRTPEEIVSSVKELCSMDEKLLSEKKVQWKSIVADVFGTVDEKTYDLFDA